MKCSSIFVLLLLISHLIGQSHILLEQDTISETHNNLDLSENAFNEFPLTLTFSNNTNDSISLNWRREFEENCPIEWTAYTSDPIISYPPMINESQLPIPINPNESNFEITQYFNPKTVAGCCDMKMIFSLEGSPNSPIDTGYYHLEVNANGCITTSISDKIESTITIYPNPSSNIINIEKNLSLESIKLYDLRGNIYFENSFSVPNTIDISSFPQGVYICSVKEKLGGYSSFKVFKL